MEKKERSTIGALVLLCVALLIGAACEKEKATAQGNGGGDGDADAEADQDGGADGDGDGDTDGDTDTGGPVDRDPLHLENDDKFGAIEVTPDNFTIDGRAAFIIAPMQDGQPAEDDGPFPVVFIHPGMFGTARDFKQFYDHIVSYGFVAVGVAFPPGNFFEGWFSHEEAAYHTIRTLDWLMSDENPYRYLMDFTYVIAAGHSLGGKIAIFAAARDARFTDVLAWDPIDTGGPPCALSDYPLIAAMMPKVDLKTACNRWSVTPEEMPNVKARLLIMGGKTGGDLSCNPEGYNHYEFFANTPEGIDALHVNFLDGNPMDWRLNNDDPTGILSVVLCSESGQKVKAEVTRITKRTNVAWLLKYTRGNAEVDEYGYLSSSGQVMNVDINAGTILVEQKP